MMIEKIVLDYLNNALEYPTYTQEQNNGEEYFYLIQKVGSSVDNKIDTSMIAVQSYAPSRYEAAEMSYAMIEAMDDIIHTYFSILNTNVCTLSWMHFFW